MADLRVTPEALHGAAARLRAENARIQAALDGLAGEAASLRTRWDGTAQVAYDNAQRQWDATFAAMNDVLRRIADATDGIADDYVASDRRSAARFGR
jgi:6 kDa early secretory antigenic target